MLEDLGHTVIKATSGADALAVLQDGKPIDLMITDYAMPGMTGLQLAEEARGCGRTCRSCSPPAMPICRRRRELELPRLSKPYQQRQLAEQIASLLG